MIELTIGHEIVDLPNRTPDDVGGFFWPNFGAPR
jgi:hypothetical protein